MSGSFSATAASRYQHAARRDAFTLVEILVSLAILSLIVVMVAQILSGSSLAISQNTKLMSAVDAAQGVFQQIDMDVSNMLLRDDVDYSFVKATAGSSGNPAGNDSLAFYSNSSGLSSTGVPATGSPRPLSIVAYQVAQNSTSNLLELDYGAQQIDWASGGSEPFTVTSATQLLTTPNTLPTVANFTLLAPEVIRMEICFQLIADPITTDSPAQLITSVPPVKLSTGISAIRNLAGIFVGIVVIDPKSRVLLPTGVDLKVAKLFPDSGSGTKGANQDVLSLWTPIVNKTATIEGAGVPAQAVGGIHVYQAYFPLSH